MKKLLPVIILAIVAIVLAVQLYSAKQENLELRQRAALLQPPLINPDAEPMPTEPTDAVASVLPTEVKQAPEPEATPAEKTEEESARLRVMKGMAEMMENPTMNKVMEASQRGAVGALYSDLIEYLDLGADETTYFMDLLMYRQMKQMDLGMKMMSGGMDEEEKKLMAQELKEAGETVTSEMEKFLNDPKDFEEFQFYEKTMDERMMLSQMDAKLNASDAALTDETYRELLGMMHDEKTNFDFNSDLHDDKNMDLSAERFSKANLDTFSSEMDQLNGNIVAKAENILTPDQLAAFKESVQSTAEMQKAQLEMAAQMFGGGK